MGYCQHVFALECDEQSKSDWYYIRKLLFSDYFGFDRNEVKLSPVYMGGKMNYCKAAIKQSINYYISAYPGKTYVHFVFDFDRSKDKALNQEIASYIKDVVFNKGAKADIIWFNRSIEQVALGKTVARRDKVDEAKKFYASKGFGINEAVMSSLLREGDLQEGQSNVLSVLYRFLPIGQGALAIKKRLNKK